MKTIEKNECRSAVANACSDTDARRDIEIIRKAIEQSRRDVVVVSARAMVCWGCMVFAVSLAVGHLWQHTGRPEWNFLWVLAAVAGTVTDVVYSRRYCKSPVSFTGKVVNYVWSVFGMSCFAVWLLAAFAYGVEEVRLPITSVIILLMCSACAVTGLVVGSRVFLGCALVSAMVAPGMAFIYAGPYEMLVLGAASLLMMVFPGVVAIRCGNR